MNNEEVIAVDTGALKEISDEILDNRAKLDNYISEFYKRVRTDLKSTEEEEQNAGAAWYGDAAANEKDRIDKKETIFTNASANMNNLANCLYDHGAEWKSFEVSQS